MTNFLIIVQFVKSRRGKMMLRIGKFTYSSKSVRGPKTIWRCSTHNSKGCLATVLTIEDDIVKFNNVHNHM